jgi:hypothetical protein
VNYSAGFQETKFPAFNVWVAQGAWKGVFSAKKCWFLPKNCNIFPIDYWEKSFYFLARNWAVAGDSGRLE